MTEDDFLNTLARLTPASIAPLDADIFDAIKEPLGRLIEITSTAPDTVLWGKRPDEQAFIGVRETEPLTNYPATAAKLIAAALERKVTPIILSSLNQSGFTRFGMRVERLTTGAGQQRCEDQLQAFWDLAIILDAQQIDALG